MHLRLLLTAFALAAALTACHRDDAGSDDDPQLVFRQGCYPHAFFWQGKYYFTVQSAKADSITLYAATTLDGIQDGQKRTVWHNDSMQHIWSPELHRINSKWYLYFEADDGNTDNHQLYVLENASDDPMKGNFRMKGPIRTNDEWNFGLHPTSFIVGATQYLAWSGWEHRRTETETQCIYIARMLNPWTLDSPRVQLSKPDLEWERQWIDPDGERSNYPIFVNENPEAFITPKGRYVCLCYSASGVWTVYHALGMLHARADADLLDPLSWTKSQQPLFTSGDLTHFYGSSNVAMVPSPDGSRQLLLYEGTWHDGEGWQRSIFVKPVAWTDDDLPDFGRPSWR